MVKWLREKRTCSKCGESKTKRGSGGYSKTQWKKGPTRRCMKCVSADEEAAKEARKAMPKAAASPSPTETEKPLEVLPPPSKKKKSTAVDDEETAPDSDKDTSPAQRDGVNGSPDGVNGAAPPALLSEQASKNRGDAPKQITETSTRRASKRAKKPVSKFCPGVDMQPPPAKAGKREQDEGFDSARECDFEEENSSSTKSTKITVRSKSHQVAFANHQTIVPPRASTKTESTNVATVPKGPDSMAADQKTPINELPFDKVAEMIPHNDKRLTGYVPKKLIATLQHHCGKSTTFSKTKANLPVFLHQWASSDDPSRSSVRFSPKGRGLVFESYEPFRTEKNYKTDKSLYDQLWKYGFKRPTHANTGMSTAFPVEYVHDDDLFVAGRPELAASILSKPEKERAKKRDLILGVFYEYNPEVARPCFREEDIMPKPISEGTREGGDSNVAPENGGDVVPSNKQEGVGDSNRVKKKVSSPELPSSEQKSKNDGTKKSAKNSAAEQNSSKKKSSRRGGDLSNPSKKNKDEPSSKRSFSKKAARSKRAPTALDADAASSKKVSPTKTPKRKRKAVSEEQVRTASSSLAKKVRNGSTTGAGDGSKEKEKFEKSSGKKKEQKASVDKDRSSKRIAIERADEATSATQPGENGATKVNFSTALHDEGWTVESKARKKGGKHDMSWFSPVKKKRFRSMAEVKRFREILAGVVGGEDKAWELFKGKKGAK